MRWHLVQVNIARMRGDVGNPIMSGLAARVDEMNRLAEQSEGFVWRLRAEDITPENLRVFDRYFLPFVPDRLFFNISVWEGIEYLQHFVMGTAHIQMLRDRYRWIERSERAHLALWWIPAGGDPPTIVESAKRLHSLHETGPTPYAFTFSAIFDP